MSAPAKELGGWRIVRQIPRPDARWELFVAERDGRSGLLTQLRHRVIKRGKEGAVDAAVARAREVRVPGLAELLDYGLGIQPWFVEAVPIEAPRLEEKLARPGALDLVETLEIGTQAAAALAALHQAGVAKEMLSPFDVVLVPVPAEPPHVILARAATGMLCLHTSRFLARGDRDHFDLSYTAPERMLAPETGLAGDVYALGAILYHCAAGAPPWMRNEPDDLRARAGKPATLRPFAPASLHRLVTTMLDGRPEARPSIDDAIRGLLLLTDHA